MSTERIIARGKVEELKIAAEQARQSGEEARGALRETIASYVALMDIDIARAVHLSAQLVKSVVDYRALCAEMAGLRQEYGI